MIEETKDPTRNLHSVALQVIYEKMQSSFNTGGMGAAVRRGRQEGPLVGDWDTLDLLVLAAHAPA